MTTGAVSNISPISELAGAVQAQNKTSSAGNFSDVLKNSSDQTKESAQAQKSSDKAKVDDKSKVTKKDDISKDDDKNTTDNVKSSGKAENQKSVDDVTSEENAEVDEAVYEAASQMVQIVSQVLEVEPQAVGEALDNLGLNESDLLNSANIPQVVVEVTGAEDSLAITTDEELFADVKEISNQADAFMEELAGKLDIEPDELKASLVKTDDTLVQNPVEQDMTQVKAGEADAQMPEIKIEKRGASQAENNDASSQMGFAQTVVDNIKAAAAQQTGESEAVFTPDMDRIYEQVTESLKLNMSEDVTEMEMSLHPASLGNVRIQIAARDGVVTANFTTQNEQVKAVLEAQIVELKESMNEQGIKVEAIEVNVAAHAFEENLSKEGDNSSEYETRGGRKRRSINLNEIDDSDDIDSDEDEIRIAREMMMHNGTTVDYLT